MRANKIIITLNISEDSNLSLRSAFEILEERKFTFQATKEIFSNGVIIRIAFTRHTLINVIKCQKFPEIIGRILRAAIRMENEIIWRILAINSHYQNEKAGTSDCDKVYLP